jgi:hypothetical protein
VDLHPAVASSSTAYGAGDTLQAGVVQIAGTNHAACWSGSAASFVDLTPAGALPATVRGASGAKQVGSVTINNSSHAALWSGSAASFVDLQTALGTAYTSSGASGVWSDGQTTYIVGAAHPVSSPTSPHAILWTLVEPPTPPALQIATGPVGAAYVTTLTWSNNGVACELESSGSLTGTWNVVSAMPVTNGDWISAVSTNVARARFFRLRAN